MDATDESIACDLLSCIVGMRMIAESDSRNGNARWLNILPKVDDVIERATAQLQTIRAASQTLSIGDSPIFETQSEKK